MSVDLQPLSTVLSAGTERLTAFLHSRGHVSLNEMMQGISDAMLALYNDSLMRPEAASPQWYRNEVSHSFRSQVIDRGCGGKECSLKILAMFGHTRC